MGQKSQIYVRFENEEKKKELIARYYGWNYEERMISRARHSVEWLIDNDNRLYNIREKMYRILDTNFDMQDVVKSSDIIKEYVEDYELWECTLNEFFYSQDNNNGVLLIDVMSDFTIKYAFLNWDYKYLGDATAYMKNEDEDWLEKPNDYHDQEDIDICNANIEYLKTNATVMNEEEVSSFLEYDYNWQLEKYRSDTPQAILISTCEREICTERFFTLQDAKNQMVVEFDSVIEESGLRKENLIDEKRAEVNDDNARINNLNNCNYDWKVISLL